jgi:hypothetical protein
LRRRWRLVHHFEHLLLLDVVVGPLRRLLRNVDHRLQ